MKCAYDQLSRKEKCKEEKHDTDINLGNVEVFVLDCDAIIIFSYLWYFSMVKWVSYFSLLNN